MSLKMAGGADAQAPRFFLSWMHGELSILPLALIAFAVDVLTLIGVGGLKAGGSYLIFVAPFVPIDAVLCATVLKSICRLGRVSKITWVVIGVAPITVVASVVVVVVVCVAVAVT